MVGNPHKRVYRPPVSYNFLKQSIEFTPGFFIYLSKSINSSTIYLRLGLYNKEYLENYSPKGLRIRVPVSGGSSQLSWNLALINRASSRLPVLNRQKYHNQTASYAYHSRQYKTWKMWTCLMICVTQLLVRLIWIPHVSDLSNAICMI